ncbi:MAG: hypothetical protein JSS32_02910 [Verrucomicrobia bacterium]|nr:hypothetical protein [Verrucomicrobiota bacterium]
MKDNILNAPLPTMIDFGKIKPKFKKNPNGDEADAWIYDMGFIPFQSEGAGAPMANSMIAFTSAPELGAFFYLIKRKYNLDIAVETGTHIGHTARFLSLYFDQVYSVEFMPEFYQEATKNLRDCANVKLHLGSSDTFLDNLLPTLKEKRLFCYLDAHGYDYWPLLNEIYAIGKTHKDNCVIAIDDFKVPGRPEIKYDYYNNQSCSFEYIEEALKSAFTEYDYHYVIPWNVNTRAKFLAIPKKWKSNE